MSARTKPKQFTLDWAFEPFAHEESFYAKKMFGGLSAYVHDRIVMVICENPGDRSYKNKTFPFDVWNGILLPTEKSFHPSLQKEFPGLIAHPVLPKWLYLPVTAADFEDVAVSLGKRIASKDDRLGVKPKPKKKK